MNLLINDGGRVSGDGYAPPPLGLLYVAGDTDTVIIDAVLDDPMPFIKEHRHELVGVGMYTWGRHEALRLLREAKELGARTVAGGHHVAAMTKQLVDNYPFIDHLVVGDGELAWKALCEKADLPRVIKMPVPDLDALPMPAWDKIDWKRYSPRGWGVQRGIPLGAVPRVSIVLGRGCSGHCSFCSTWWVNGKYRAHGKDWMARELDLLWNMGARHLVFQDDCLSADRAATIDLCDVMEGYGFAWFGTTRADCLDLDLAQRMRAVGCYELSFGIESGSPAILKRMHKQVDLADAFTAREACRAAGIKFTALMMEGYPGGTAETAREDRQFRAKLKPDEYGSIGHTGVMPGTALYQECKRAGLITDDFWLGPADWYIYHGGLE